MLNNKSGFSLIEIIVAILIVGVMATAITQFRPGNDPNSINKFIIELNNLVKTAQNDAYMTNKVQKIEFDFEQDKITSRTIGDKSIQQSINIPTGLDFDNLIINKKDELTGGKAYFLISSEGITQEIEFNIINIETNNIFKASINPFMARFKLKG